MFLTDNHQNPISTQDLFSYLKKLRMRSVPIRLQTTSDYKYALQVYHDLMKNMALQISPSHTWAKEMQLVVLDQNTAKNFRISKDPYLITVVNAPIPEVYDVNTTLIDLHFASRMFGTAANCWKKVFSELPSDFSKFLPSMPAAYKRTAEQVLGQFEDAKNILDKNGFENVSIFLNQLHVKLYVLFLFAAFVDLLRIEYIYQQFVGMNYISHAHRLYNALYELNKKPFSDVKGHSLHHLLYAISWLPYQIYHEQRLQILQNNTLYFDSEVLKLLQEDVLHLKKFLENEALSIYKSFCPPYDKATFNVFNHQQYRQLLLKIALQMLTISDQVIEEIGKHALDMYNKNEKHWIRSKRAEASTITPTQCVHKFMVHEKECVAYFVTNLQHSLTAELNENICNSKDNFEDPLARATHISFQKAAMKDLKGLASHFKKLSSDIISEVKYDEPISRFWDSMILDYEWEAPKDYTVKEDTIGTLMTLKSVLKNDNVRDYNWKHIRAIFLLECMFNLPLVYSAKNNAITTGRHHSWSMFPTPFAIDALHLLPKTPRITTTAPSFTKCLYDMALYLFTSQCYWSHYASIDSTNLNAFASFSRMFSDEKMINTNEAIHDVLYRFHSQCTSVISQIINGNKQKIGDSKIVDASSSDLFHSKEWDDVLQDDFAKVSQHSVIVGYNIASAVDVVDPACFCSSNSRSFVSRNLNRALSAAGYNQQAWQGAFAQAIIDSAQEFLGAKHAKIFSSIRNRQYYGWGARKVFAPGHNGRIDVRKLARFSQEVDMYPFKQQTIRSYPALDVTLILDSSSSMEAHFYENLAACIAIMTVLRRIPGIKVRLCSFKHVLVDYLEPLLNIPIIIPSNDTPLHLPLRYVWNRRMKRSAAQQVVIVITDGGANNTEATRLLSEAVMSHALLFGVFYVPEDSSAADKGFIIKNAQKISYVLSSAPTCVYRKPSELIDCMSDLFQTVVSL